VSLTAAALQLVIKLLVKYICDANSSFANMTPQEVRKQTHQANKSLGLVKTGTAKAIPYRLLQTHKN
jgi:hypothetical protein